MDTLGVPLLKEETQSIWEEQRHHVSCLQDPPGVELYTITGHINKGGVTLPVFRCAWASTSLESFHLHLARFVPGSAAGAVNLQAFLLDGMTRWNTSRAAEAIQSAKAEEGLRSFDVCLIDKVNGLSQTLHGKSVVPKYIAPSVYTGELFGVEYLYDQPRLRLNSSEDNLDREIDKGFEDVEDELATGSIPILEEDCEYLSVYPPEEKKRKKKKQQRKRRMRHWMRLGFRAGIRWIPLPSP